MCRYSVYRAPKCSFCFECDWFGFSLFRRLSPIVWLNAFRCISLSLYLAQSTERLHRSDCMSLCMFIHEAISKYRTLFFPVLIIIVGTKWNQAQHLKHIYLVVSILCTERSHFRQKFHFQFHLRRNNTIKWQVETCRTLSFVQLSSVQFLFSRLRHWFA